MGTDCQHREFETILDTIPCLPPDMARYKVKLQASLNRHIQLYVLTKGAKAQSQDLLRLLLAKDRIRRKPRSSTCALLITASIPDPSTFGYLWPVCLVYLIACLVGRHVLILIYEKREVVNFIAVGAATVDLHSFRGLYNG